MIVVKTKNRLMTCPAPVVAPAAAHRACLARKPCPSPIPRSPFHGAARGRDRYRRSRRRRRRAAPWSSTSPRTPAACPRTGGCGRASELCLAAVGFRAAGAEGALVHLAAQAERTGLRELRRTERAGVEAVAAADAQVLVVQHDAVVGAVEAVDRAHRHARRVRAVHAGHRDRFLGADDAVIDGHHAAAVDAPRHFVLLLACGDAAVALDAALGVAQEFHSCHGGLLMLLRPGKASSWFPASASPGHSRRSSRY